MKNKSLVLLFLILMPSLILTGCTDEPMNLAPTIATPEANKTVITGRLLNDESSAPYTNTLVRLAEVYRNEQGEGAFALDQSFSPGTYTDENGYFVFNNLTPGEFVMVVGDPTVNYLIIVDETSKQAKIYKGDAGQILDIGTLSIDF
ncbi:MAG TPA: hypothetical protein PLS77_13010 [Anaerolineaceae bacterium]|jgi:hypothetical protein|nr:hypothetical protein [Anaerolineaceae bacterium]HNZ01967.1 hypothetical protein [Anaerolineaceae bacterium]HOH20991.1 hypothetical protein [Anaerolineaceae bacterium]HOU45270.1 hypothetical protein [Anaerolineaceae bacterium]HQF46816.1 hypothetical protein [Anaerolineaceae bacterium]